MKNYVKKLLKHVMVAALIISFIVGINGNIANAAPAPKLTSVSITDLTVDDNGEIHVEVTFKGTPKYTYVYWNGRLLTENINEEQYIWGRDKIAIGYVKYYHTGIYLNTMVSGQVVNVSVEATNAMSPWNTLSTSRIFTLP